MAAIKLSALARRRLKKLADYMDGLPRVADKHFDMGDWVAHYDEHGDHELLVYTDHGFTSRMKLGRDHILKTCGTKACAFGWAATEPSFIRAGLFLRADSTVVYKRDVGFSAAAKFFDLDPYQANYLFGEVDVNTPKEWARACRMFLKDNGAVPD